MTTPYFDGEGIRYSHPDLEPEYASTDIIIYRVNPKHGVAIVKTAPETLVISHVTYERGLEQDALNMDPGSLSSETMHTNVASDITAFIDVVSERYLLPVKLSDMMRDQIDPYDF